MSVESISSVPLQAPARSREDAVNTTARIEPLPLQYVQSFFEGAMREVTASNWREIFSSALTFVSSIVVQAPHERLVMSWLARLLEKAYFLKREEGGVALFTKELESVFPADSLLPSFLTRPGDLILGKQQPSFVESLPATLERFSVVEQLKSTFSSNVSSIVIGGSMNYGPFFNIRAEGGPLENSDIDALGVMSPSFFNDDTWGDFLASNLFSAEEKNKFLQRKRVGFRMLKEGVCDVFSHRFSLQNHNFTFSVHFFTPELLEDITGSGLQADLQARTDTVKIINDYRSDRFARSEIPHLTFDGSNLLYVVPPQTEVEGGYVVQLPAYMVANGNLHTGLYLNLIAPEFRFLYDESGSSSKSIENLRQTLVIEIEEQKEKTSKDNLSMANLQPRSPLIEPGRYS